MEGNAIVIMVLSLFCYFRYPFTEDQDVMEPDWQVFIRETARGMVAQQTQDKLLEVRGRLYELLTHGIPPDVIFKASSRFPFSNR